MDVMIERSGSTAHVRLNGCFDINANLTFRNAVKPLLSEGSVNTMTIDFDRVPFMDSSALGMLLLLREQAEHANKSIVLCGCGSDLKRVLAIAQFHRIFRIE